MHVINFYNYNLIHPNHQTCMSYPYPTSTAVKIVLQYNKYMDIYYKV